MKISICIPVYNVYLYVTECLDSIIKSISLYKGFVGYEILIVDDCSTDGSKSAIREFARTHDRVVVREHELNKGVAEARNTLLSMSTGDYIAWVDPDDSVTEDWFSLLATAVQDENPDVVAFDLQYLTNGKLGSSTGYGTIGFGLKPGEKRHVDGKEYACKVMQAISMFSYLPTRIARRELHHGLLFRAPRGVYEDTIFDLDFLPRVKTVYYIERSLYIYRQRGDSIMHTRKTGDWLREIEVMRQTISEMKSPYKDAATVHLMTAMRRVMMLSLKNPVDKLLRENAKEFKRFYRRHVGLVLFEPYLPFKRRIADLLTMLPFSNLLLRKRMG